jgi:predicted MFS family arabinose efflux permease
MFLVGTSFGPAIGGFVSDRFGLGSPFIVYGMCTTISVLMILFWIEDITPLHDGAKKVSLNRLGRLLVRWDLLAINLATIAIFVTRQGVLNTLVPLYSKYNLGLGEGALGTILTLSAVCNLGTMLVAGRMTDIYGRKPFMIISLIMLAVIVCLIPLTTDSLGFTIVLMAAGLAIGLTGPVAAWITDVCVPEDLAEAMGLFRTMGDLGFVIAPFALASIAGEAGESMGATSFIIAGIALVVLSLPLLSIKDPVAEKRKTID